jgi:hypothetical protein
MTWCVQYLMCEQQQHAVAASDQAVLLLCNAGYRTANSRFPGVFGEFTCNKHSSSMRLCYP